MNKKLINTMVKLEELREEYKEFKETAYGATDKWSFRFTPLDELYDVVYKEYWRKLILWGDFNRNKDNYNHDCKIYDWGFKERESQEKGNLIKFNLERYPLDFDVKYGENRWDIKAIDEAFKKVVDAQINRNQLIEVLKNPIQDIRSFEKKLEKEIENQENQLIKFYDSILENEKVKELSLLKSLFNDETVKEVVVKELLGVEIKK